MKDGVARYVVADMLRVYSIVITKCLPSLSLDGIRSLFPIGHLRPHTMADATRVAGAEFACATGRRNIADRRNGLPLPLGAPLAAVVLSAAAGAAEVMAAVEVVEVVAMAVVHPAISRHLAYHD